jgi:hypothetical protein
MGIGDCSDLLRSCQVNVHKLLEMFVVRQRMLRFIRRAWGEDVD